MDTAPSPGKQTLRFTQAITAPPEVVERVMLAPDTYSQWTAAFCEGSRFEGGWNAGDAIRFLDPNGDGMVAEIAERRPAEHLRIRHLGYIQNGVADTTSEAIRAWAPAYETYCFARTASGCEVQVEMDCETSYLDFMQRAWPDALGRLKALAEGAA